MQLTAVSEDEAQLAAIFFQLLQRAAEEDNVRTLENQFCAHSKCFFDNFGGRTCAGPLFSRVASGRRECLMCGDDSRIIELPRETGKYRVVGRSQHEKIDSRY